MAEKVDEEPSISSKINIISKSKSDQIEQKIWNIIQEIPGLNVGYGTIRLIVYITKSNKDESWKSATGVAKGLVQSAAIAGSVFVAPFVTPIAAGALAGVVTGSIKGAANLIIFIIEHPDEFLRRTTSDSKEEVVYNEAVEEIPGVNSAYSVARIAIYASKGDTEKATKSGINAVNGGIQALTSGFGGPTALDEETNKVIQKLFRTITQLLPRKNPDLSEKKKLEFAVQEDISEAFKYTSQIVQDEDKSSVPEKTATPLPKIPNINTDEALEKTVAVKNVLERILNTLKIHKKIQIAKSEEKSVPADEKELITNNNSEIDAETNTSIENLDSLSESKARSRNSIVVITKNNLEFSVEEISEVSETVNDTCPIVQKEEKATETSIPSLPNINQTEALEKTTVVKNALERVLNILKVHKRIQIAKSETKLIVLSGEEGSNTSNSREELQTKPKESDDLLASEVQIGDSVLVII